MVLLLDGTQNMLRNSKEKKNQICDHFRPQQIFKTDQIIEISPHVATISELPSNMYHKI